MANTLTLQKIRDTVRLQLDLETEDLPDALIDVWAQEAYDIAIAAQPRWRFFEVIATQNTSADLQAYPFDTILSTAALEQIYAVRGERWNLLPVSQRIAESAFNLQTAVTREPNYFSTWNRTMYLWPIPDAAYSLQVSGYRQPLDWITLGGAGAIPDCPSEFHRTLLAWVMSRAYLQQDDPGTAQMLELQFSNQLRVLGPRFTSAPHTGPLLVNQGEIQGGPLGRLWFDWE